MTKFKLLNKGDFYKVYINGYLHLAVKKDEIMGFQSFAMDDVAYPFQIEIYTKFETITIEYDRVQKWKKMLQLMDKII